MKKSLWIVVAALLVLVGCGLAPAPAMPTEYKNLQPSEQTAVTAEPDATTKALGAAGYRPFGIQYRLPDRDGKDEFAVIYYGKPGSNIKQGHGSTAEPWVSRSLKKVPTLAADWRNFNAALIVYGDDWPGTDTIRPSGLTQPHYQCSTGIEPDKPVTADDLKQLPAKVMAHANGKSFDLPVGQQKFSCFKL